MMRLDSTRLWPMLLLMPLAGCVALGNQVVPVVTHRTYSLQPGQLQLPGPNWPGDLF